MFKEKKYPTSIRLKKTQKEYIKSYAKEHKLNFSEAVNILIFRNVEINKKVLFLIKNPKDIYNKYFNFFVFLFGFILCIVCFFLLFIFADDETISTIVSILSFGRFA